jgi:hypothetical protein
MVVLLEVPLLGFGEFRAWSAGPCQKRHAECTWAAARGGERSVVAARWSRVGTTIGPLFWFNTVPRRRFRAGTSHRPPSRNIESGRTRGSGGSRGRIGCRAIGRSAEESAPTVGRPRALKARTTASPPDPPRRAEGAWRGRCPPERIRCRNTSRIRTDADVAAVRRPHARSCTRSRCRSRLR